MADKIFTDRVRAYVAASGGTVPFRAATEDAIMKAEEELEFRIPELLRACYLGVGNGGYGPGYGLIGVAGGYASDCGDLVQTYKLFQESEEFEGKTWPEGMLPFCEWGCNIYTCVVCKVRNFKIFTYEELHLRENRYTLPDFFELWMAGVNILSYDHESYSPIKRRINNPFRKYEE